MLGVPIVATGIALLGALVPLALLLWWARWLRKTGAPRWVRLVASLLAASPLASVPLACSGVVSSQAAVEGASVDPSQKARILAEGISETMNCTALGTILALIPIAWLLACTLRYHWLRKDPKGSGEPPYR
jgi:hypothetical protein